MATVTIVGSGMMGSALAFPARENGHTVRLVGTPLDRAIIDAAQADGTHITLKRHLPDGIKYYQSENYREALDGADLILVPTVNVKSEPLEMFEWEMRVQAFQNSVAIAMCNRVGHEGEMDFAGESLVTDASGNLLAKADDKEQILYTDVDLSQSAITRASRPYTNLRQPQWYC